MCKKRIIVLSICGIMATSLVGAFLLPVRARSMGISFPLLHHHSEACLGKVVRRQESDSPGSLNKTYEDICPNCGGAIVGAADKDYICRYCGSKIMDVIVKK